MKGQTLTQWFPASEAPVHKGVYERDMSRLTKRNEDFFSPYAYFDGKKWLLSGKTPCEAENTHYYCSSGYQNLPWRGIAK